MLKISQPAPGSHAVILKLEGRVIGPWVTELKIACEKQLAEHRVVKLDFTDVSFADPRGIALLVELRSRGVGLLNCSPFLEQELNPATPWGEVKVKR